MSGSALMTDNIAPQIHCCINIPRVSGFVKKAMEKGPEIFIYS